MVGMRGRRALSACVCGLACYLATSVCQCSSRILIHIGSPTMADTNMCVVFPTRTTEPSSYPCRFPALPASTNRAFD